MLTDTLPIETFVTQRFQLPRVKKVLDSLAVDPEKLVAPIVRHFHEMGLFTVPRQLEEVILEDLLNQLQNSPDIRMLVGQAARERARLASQRR